MFRLILSPEAHRDIAEKTFALARAYIQWNCLREADAICDNARWHEEQAKRTEAKSQIQAAE